MGLDWVNLETLAVALGVAYLVLAMRENSLCWYCAFFSTALYVWIFGDVSLYMESALNVYYMGMAIYGWFQWQRGGINHEGLEIIRWTAKQHGLAISAIVLAALVSGYLLSIGTDARLPYLDSLTTWGSILTTVMVARKVLENWLYWIVINSISIYLYLDRGLEQTASMFMLYLVLAILGYYAWRKKHAGQNRDIAA
ncbi:MAG: nicotinamide mononucleotide transporter [Porticoccaceae bacterium]|nr:nicotinamide mononucleotide transporter [Porticoccaceae bacterium]MBT4163976.1 nicotinamide mononucleotide transporter [Porticoccaceae bacterium]MBT4211746.1 nicotinamide mononucleotide transporter [Porticoccaceae bacterium]MBT5103703.1 nicotinamide mononucleotide transporter [Porticoccaceae bacterium]MBT6028431.1 nicotinamide mononucleotide transporter [Porticoccaceae bacterium]